MSRYAIIAAAARGRLPAWARFSPSRYAHMQRVAELLGTWAEQFGLPEHEVERWRAVGYLHDALKGVDAEELRDELGTAAEGLPDPVLHGPAAARRLAAEGIDDEALLRAIAGHTLGDAEFDRLGCCLYAADFLEPGRNLRNEWRAGLRARMPEDWPEVVNEVLAARIEHQIERERPVHRATMDFWNARTEGAAWASASEL